MNATRTDPAITAGFIMPHPPVLIPEVGKGREADASATIAGCRAVAARIAALKPETIVFISPHAPLFSDYLFMYDESVLSGSFARFGAHSVKLSCKQDSDFVGNMKSLLGNAGIPGGTPEPGILSRFEGSDQLDHGVLVPLHFIKEAYADFKAVCLSCSAFETDKVLAVGHILREAARKTGCRTVIVASGDLSHRVSADSPYGMVKEGALFDSALTGAIAAGNLAGILSIDPFLREQAAECGYNSFVMLTGALGLDAPERHPETASLKTALYSDEAPFGIGYCTAGFELPESGAVSAGGGAASGGFSWPVALARAAIDQYVRTGVIIGSEGHDGHDVPRAGCFVSLKKKGELRGCIGTIAPTRATIEEEIIRNAVAACSSDYRFDPVDETELADLAVSVDILGPPEPVASRDELDPSKYGVIVTSGYSRGLLLPDLEGVDSVDVQLAIACRKGGIDPEKNYEIERFTVTRYH